VRARFRLDRRLTQETLAARERAEELIVQIVPVGQYHDGRVLHRRFADDPPGVERHRQALARALGVPDDTDPSISRLASMTALVIGCGPYHFGGAQRLPPAAWTAWN
jgi:hypothetical protein